MYILQITQNSPDVKISTSSVEAAEFPNTLRMDQVYDLLVQMITILQQVAVSQAGQLKFLNTWQRAYTDRMASVHTFVAKNGDAGYVSGADTEQGTVRQDLNASNTTFTEVMRSSTQIVGDTAKSLKPILAKRKMP